MKNYSQITYKYLRIHKKRTILTILGIVLSVALITSIGTLAVSFRAKLIKDAIESQGNYQVCLSKVDGSDINKIKDNVDVNNYGITHKVGSGIISDISREESTLKSGKKNYGYRYLTINAYDKGALRILSPKLKEGRFPKNSNEIAVTYWTKNYFENKPKIGGKIKMPIGTRKDPNGGEVDEHSWSSEEVFQKTEEKEYTIVGFISPDTYSSNCFLADGITYIYIK